MKRFAAVCGVLLSTLAVPVPAQTAIQPGTIVGTFNAGGFSNNGVIFTVPGDRNARVTDIKVHNFDAAQLCHPQITLGTAQTWFSVNAASQTIGASVVSGYGLLPGQTVSLDSNGCPTPTSIYVEIRGFYFTIP